MGRNATLKERHKWAIERPQLDNARRLGGIYFIDPEDKEFKETIRNARRKLETPVAPAMPCKTCKKSKKGRFVARLMSSSINLRRMEDSLPKYHEDHIAGKGDKSLQHYNLAQ